MKLFSDDNSKMVWIDARQVQKQPREIRRLYEDFAVLKGERYGSPRSFNQMTMAWYLNRPNNGQSANVRCDPETYEFYAKRDIALGEELTVDYDEFSEEPRSRGRTG